MTKIQWILLLIFLLAAGAAAVITDFAPQKKTAEHRKTGDNR